MSVEDMVAEGRECGGGDIRTRVGGEDGKVGLWHGSGRSAAQCVYTVRCQRQEVCDEVLRIFQGYFAGRVPGYIGLTMGRTVRTPNICV